MEKHFNSPAEIVAYLASAPGNNDYRDAHNPEWFGHGDTFAKQQELIAKGGDETLVPAAMKMLDKLHVAMPETDRSVFIPAVAGAYPCVPDYIMGLPEPMRKRDVIYDTGAPIRLGAYTGCSATISHSQFIARATCFLAIIMRLVDEGRPVEVYAVDSGNGTDGETLITVKLQSAPVSIAEIGHALTNLGFTRRVFYGAQDAMGNGYNGAWPAKFDCATNGRYYAAKLAKRLNLDVLLPPLYGTQSNALMADPVKWTLDQYNAIQARINGDIQD